MAPSVATPQIIWRPRFLGYLTATIVVRGTSEQHPPIRGIQPVDEEEEVIRTHLFSEWPIHSEVQVSSPRTPFLDLDRPESETTPNGLLPHNRQSRDRAGP